MFIEPSAVFDLVLGWGGGEGGGEKGKGGGGGRGTGRGGRSNQDSSFYGGWSSQLRWSQKRFLSEDFCALTAEC